MGTKWTQERSSNPYIECPYCGLHHGKDSKCLMRDDDYEHATRIVAAIRREESE